MSQWPKWLRRQYGKLEICGSSPGYDTIFLSKNYQISDCIQVMVFFRGHVAQVARRLAMGSTARVRSRVSEGWRFSSFLHVQTAPGAHSAYYKMSTGVKAAERNNLPPFLYAYKIKKIRYTRKTTTKKK